LFNLTVQRHSKRDILVQGICCWLRCISAGQHYSQTWKFCQERPRLPLVGQVPVIQDWYKKWGVLFPAIQPEQVLPFGLRLLWLLLLLWTVYPLFSGGGTVDLRYMKKKCFKRMKDPTAAVYFILCQK